MESHQLRISVVIPAYNAEQHLEEALASVVAQDLQPCEIIVIDDGSTDGTAEIARGFSPLVKCHTQENSGPAAARNAGIRLARGSHIAFLDADDRWLTCHLADLAAALTKYATRWSASAFTVWFDDDPARNEDLAIPGLAGQDAVLLDDYFQACGDKWTVWTSACLIQRDLLLELGGFDPALAIGEDLNLWFRIALVEPSLGYCPRASAVYRQVSDSVMHTIASRGEGWYVGLQRMLAAATDHHALQKVRPLLARYANSAARHAGRRSQRVRAWRLLTRHGRLLLPSIRVRLALSVVLPGFLNRRLWSLRG